MARNNMYRKLPFQGAEPRLVAEVVNNLVEGKSNNTGEITLNTGWANTTTIYDERIGYDSVIYLMPYSTEAFFDTTPYGVFSDTTTQLAPSIGNTAVVVFDTTEISNGIYVNSGTPSRMYVRNAGTYNVAFTVQLQNNSNDGEFAEIWYRVNGADVTRSASRFGLPARKSTGDPSEMIGAMNLFLELTAGDYVELAGATSSTDISLWSSPAQTSPFIRPAIPSVICTVNYVAPNNVNNIYISNTGKGEATIAHFANNIADKTYRYLIVG